MEWIDLFGFGRRSSEIMVSDDLSSFFTGISQIPAQPYPSTCCLFFPLDTPCQIGIEMRADVLPPGVCGLGDGEAAFEQVAVFVFGRGVRLGLVLFPKPQLGDGAAQAGIVAEDAEMVLVERLQDGAAECVLEVV